MTTSTPDSATTALQPVPGAMNLLQGDAAGCCGGIACGVPATTA